MLGKGNDQGEVLIEGDQKSPSSIQAWQKERLGPEPEQLQHQQTNGDDDDLDSRPPSSGLSSVGDRLDGEEMDFS
jgi:transcription initiation factor TFIID subunit 3